MRAPPQRQIQRNSLEHEYAEGADRRWSSYHMGAILRLRLTMAQS